MDRTVFFKNQLLKTLDKNLPEQGKFENLKFVIIPSDAPREKPKTNWDEIINWWVLPSNTGIKLSLDQTIEVLGSRQGLMPLWIKLKLQHETLILLHISRRFRKLDDIKLFHQDNETMPFIFDQSLDLIFTVADGKF